MPGQVSKVVVLSQDDYHRLANSSHPTPLLPPSEPLPTESRDVEVQTEASVTVAPPASTHAEYQPASPTPLPFDPLDGIPPRYTKACQSFLLSLANIPEIAWSLTDGVLTLGGEEQEDFGIAELLKATCVPFSKLQVPQDCLQLLKRAGITKFRNHLCGQPKPPPWSPYYKL